jgi:hypothetical protein
LTEKSRTPRPPSKRAPYKPKASGYRGVRKVTAQEKLDQAGRTLTLDERACVHLAVEYSEEHAATTLGWELDAVHSVLARTHVRRYVERAEDAFLEKLASSKLRVLKKIGINSAAVEQRLMELAQMDPEETRGSIEGQVKALRTLAEILGMLDNDDPLKNKTREEMQQIIVEASTKILPVSTTDDEERAPQ